MVNQTQAVACSVCLCVTVTLLLVILLPLAFSVLDPLEYGLDINDITKFIDLDEVYDGGRYHLGIGHSFVVFPRTLQIIDFSPDEDSGGATLNAGTLDKQIVRLEVTLYYRIVKESIKPLYSDFGLEYHQAIVLKVKDTLKNVATEFTTAEYFTNRKAIAQEMQARVSTSLQESHVEVALLQLRNIGLPPAIESARIKTVVAQQSRITAELDLQVQSIAAETKVLDAGFDAVVTALIGEASAEASLISEQGRANGTSLLVGIEEISYQLLKSDLGFSNSQLAQFLWATRKLRSSVQQDTLLVGFEDSNKLLTVNT